MSEMEIIKRFSKAQDSLVIQQSDFSLSAILQMVTSKAIDIAPHYQRRDRWNAEKQSSLIESFLLNVPVPPVYLSEDDYGTYSVIDGKQRITAICDFLSNKLKLKDLIEFPDLNGSTFDDLPSQLKNALTVRPYIRVITLLKQSDKELKYEVFLRLNTGGEKLKPQEIRNVAYAGPLNDLLFELSENLFLKSNLKITSEKSTAYRNMDDVEHVLRFFTISECWSDMRGTLAHEMDSFMALHRYDNVQSLKALFMKAINGCEQIWKEFAFKKPVGNGWREQLISPLYDSQMVAVSLLDDQKIAHLSHRHAEVIHATQLLYENDIEFVKSISQSTNNAASVQKRVSALFNMLNTL